MLNLKLWLLTIGEKLDDDQLSVQASVDWRRKSTELNNVIITQEVYIFDLSTEEEKTDFEQFQAQLNIEA